MIDINEISATKALEYTNSGALFIDVREKDEIEQMAYNIPNVLNIPLSIFDDNFLDIPKDTNVILACKMGGKSLKASQFLVVNGWDSDKIFNLTGGIVAWEKAKLPIKSKPRSFVMAKPSSGGCCGGTSCC